MAFKRCSDIFTLCQNILVSLGEDEGLNILISLREVEGLNVLVLLGEDEGLNLEVRS
jgi:hypothetical protein